MSRNFNGGSFSVEIERYDEDTDTETLILVEGTFYPGTPAITSGPPDRWCPGDGPEVDIQTCTDEDGKEVELTDAEYNEVCERAEQRARDEHDDYLEDLAEQRYEESRYGRDYDY